MIFEEDSDDIFDDSHEPFLKRRSVKWITSAPLRRHDFDPMLIPIIYSHGTVIDANPYSSFINRSIYDIYVKDGKLHTIFNITKTEDISAYDFNQFISLLFEIKNTLENDIGLVSDDNDLVIKTSVNSPGPVELITGATSAFIALSSLSLFLSGAHVKFSYNVFNLFSGDIKIDSPGLIEKVRDFYNSIQTNNRKTKELESKIRKSENNLKIRNKKKKG